MLFLSKLFFQICFWYIGTYGFKNLPLYSTVIHLWTCLKFMYTQLHNLYSKGNHQQNKKTTYPIGEGICKSYIQYEVNIQIYKELIHLNSKKTKQLNLKMGKGDKQ